MDGTVAGVAADPSLYPNTPYPVSRAWDVVPVHRFNGHVAEHIDWKNSPDPIRQSDFDPHRTAFAVAYTLYRPTWHEDRFVSGKYQFGSPRAGVPYGILSVPAERVNIGHMIPPTYSEQAGTL